MCKEWEPGNSTTRWNTMNEPAPLNCNYENATINQFKYRSHENNSQPGKRPASKYAGCIGVFHRIAAYFIVA